MNFIIKNKLLNARSFYNQYLKKTIDNVSLLYIYINQPQHPIRELSFHTEYCTILPRTSSLLALHSSSSESYSFYY
jgi:hypothetical protein